MRRISHLLASLMVLGLIWVFWPFGNEEDVVTIEPPRPTGHDGRLFTTPLSETPAPEKKTTAERPPEVSTDRAAEATKLFYRVLVQDGGTLQAGDTLIVLEGIAAYDADAQCKDTNGRRWACGTRARAALRRRIQGRTVRCQVPASSSQARLTARCTVAGTDLSHWMVSQGWAKPSDPAETKLAGAAEAARKRKAGIWR